MKQGFSQRPQNLDHTDLDALMGEGWPLLTYFELAKLFQVSKQMKMVMGATERLKMAVKERKKEKFKESMKNS